MHSYVQKVKVIYESHRNPENAGPMKKYLKDQFELLGIKRPERDVLNKSFFVKVARPDREDIIAVMYDFWDLQHREFQYIAMDLLGYYCKDPEKKWIRDIEKLITMKSWWDTVDFLAATVAGDYFKKFHEQILPVTNHWMDSQNMWLQRSCILFQLKYKSDTNTELLDSFIQRCRGSKEFFINKAIGWALREYSKTDPAYVIKYVDENELNPLSKREALKVINRGN